MKNFDFLTVLMLAFTYSTCAHPTPKSEPDNQPAESGIVSALLALPPGADTDDLSTFPYENYHEPQPAYGVPPPPQPSFGVSVNTQAILAPQVEIIRLIESFIKVKSEALTRLQGLINDNWDLVRSALNLIINKLQNLHTFILKGVRVLRQILEFTLSLMADWSVTLPSFTFGSTTLADIIPHSFYGAPPAAGSKPTFG